MEEKRVPIVGSQHHSGALEALRGIPIDADIELRRDRDNSYDANAVGCYYGGQMLGYVPRTHNSPIAAAMDRCRKVSARLSAPPLIGGTTAKPILSEPARIIVTWEGAPEG